MSEILIYISISAGTVFAEKLLDLWVKHSKSTHNKVDDLVSKSAKTVLIKLKKLLIFKK